jgi:hypothetical protein
MPPKKRTGKELPTEGSSQATEGQVFTTAQANTQTIRIPPNQPSIEPFQATTELTSPKDPAEQPTTQTKVLSMNTSAPNTVPPPSHQYQTIETQEDLQQDSEEEIEAVIEDELACLLQENEHLQLMQEHLAKRKTTTKRSQVMQQQIEQERATKAELQRVIEDLRQQEPPLQQQQP